MFRYTLSTLRFRKAGFVGAFIALFCAAAMVVACGTLLETGLRGAIDTERYSAAPIVVAGDQDVHEVTVKEKSGKPDKVKRKSKPLFERVWLSAETVATVRSVPGVDAAIPELEFPAYVVAGDGSVLSGPDGAASLGHAWESARLTPFRLIEGDRPSETDDVVIDRELAERAGLRVGDHVTVQSTEAPSRYDVAGIAQAERRPLTQQSSLFFARSEAQRLADRPGHVAVVGVFPEPGVDVDELRDDVAGALEGTSAQVHAGADRGAAEFLDASNARIELISMGGAMGGTAVLVALLVVVGTFALSIQQRYREIALLRAVAATPRQIRRLIGREALLVGVVAGSAGALAGRPLAGALRALFERFGAFPETLELVRSPFPVAAGVVLAVGGAWSAARVSARRTSRMGPAHALAEAAVPSRLIAVGRLLTGIVVLIGGVVLLGVLSRLRTEPAAQPVTFLVVVVLAIAVALLGPVVARAAASLLWLPLRVVPGSGYLAAANARADTGRLASVLTPLSLMVAMACTVLFTQTTLAGAAREESEQGTIADRVLVADGPGIPSAAADEMRRLAGVEAVTEIVNTTVRVGLDRVDVQGVTVAGITRTIDLDVTSGAIRRLDEDGVALSDVTAGDLGVGVGDTLDVTMGDGTSVRRTVVAVYGRSLGFADMVMERDVVAAHVDNPLSSSMLVALRDKDDVPLRAVAAEYPGVEVFDQHGAEILRARQLQDAAQVGYVALGLVVVFTAIAVVNTLAMSTGERTREFALLRLVGATRRQVRRMLWLESLAVVAIGTVLGTVMALATLTAFSTGMTGNAAPHVAPAQYAGIVALAGLLAIAATAIPGRLAMRSKPERSISRHE